MARFRIAVSGLAVGVQCTLVLSCSESSGTQQPPVADASVDRARDAPYASEPEAGATGPESFQPEWFDCASDSDCVIVQTQACVACLVDAVNKDHEEDFIRAAQSSDSPNCRPGPCAPRPEGTACIDGKCDEIVDCSSLGAFCGSFAKCVQLRGRTCADADAATMLVDFGCVPKAPAVTAGQTCAEDPDTGQTLLFTSTQIPEGWNPCETSECP